MVNHGSSDLTGQIASAGAVLAHEALALLQLTPFSEDEGVVGPAGQGSANVPNMSTVGDSAFPSGPLGIVERGSCGLLHADVRPRLGIERELRHRACHHVRDRS